LLYIAEKQCRGYHELKEYANHIGISESYLKVILSKTCQEKANYKILEPHRSTAQREKILYKPRQSHNHKERVEADPAEVHCGCS